ncbi:MAG TPA: class I SAM-dependent methyltransferase [Gammaproteobacteria bacterium]
MSERAEHWDRVYRERAADEVSWYQSQPRLSLRLVEATGVGRGEALIDVGGGASRLVDCLLQRDYRDLSVLDVSAEALAVARRRLGDTAAAVHWIHADVTGFVPSRRYRLWHDRAVFHFLTGEQERARYVEVLRRALLPQAHLVIATFAPDGPRKCSGLPVCQYDGEALCRELGAGFELLDATRERHLTPGAVEQRFAWFRLRYRAPA